MTTYTIDQLARMIDHTNLKAFADKEAMAKLCQEAKDYHFKMVAINQVQSAICHEFLKDTDINVGAAISFPLGQTSIESKLFDIEDAVKNGADEIDYVVNLTEVKNGNWEYVKDEMQRIVSLCRELKVLIKVIFENCYLEKEEIIHLAEIAKAVEPDFIKSSTGFGTAGAKVEDVKLMKETVGSKVKVKAAGGIRDAETFKAMIAAGAERIGCSAGIPIIESLKKELEDSGQDSIEI